MSDDGNFLSRWSRRKIDARSGRQLEPEQTPEEPVVPVETGTRPEAEARAELPPLESLTPDSDFTAFMKPDVDPAMRREALKVLVRDPRFNVMDGLDVYIDDYSKPDPIPEEWLSQLNMMKRLGSFVEEPGKPAAEAPAALQNSMPEQPLEAGAEGDSSDTGIDKASNDAVTESGTAGVKLPRNEA
ncbi:MAG TPA: DUF3306 domain-containing protein [Usitatibacter sp.]|nr:DUF3306 domain-containing protein [Usitatibacter sp.]